MTIYSVSAGSLIKFIHYSDAPSFLFTCGISPDLVFYYGVSADFAVTVGVMPLLLQTCTYRASLMGF